MFDLDEALSYVVRRDGSDLHLKVPSRPLARIHGQLLALEYYDPMRPEDTERVLGEMLADHHDRMLEFDQENEVDFAFAAASSPHDFKLLVAGDGRTPTSMEDIASDDHSGLRPVDIPAGPESDDSSEEERSSGERPQDHEPASRFGTSTPPPFAA